mgnify:CR=1 FL=1
MSDDDIFKPLSAKVEPKRPSWSDTNGSRGVDPKRAAAALQGWAKKKIKSVKTNKDQSDER